MPDPSTTSPTTPDAPQLEHAAALVDLFRRVVREELVPVVRQVVREELEATRRRDALPDQLLTVDDVAEVFAMSKRTVERVVSSGELIPIRIGGQRRFTRKAVEAFVRGCAGGKVNRRRKPQSKRRSP